MKEFRLADLDKTARVCCRTAAAYPGDISKAATTALPTSEIMKAFVQETETWTLPQWEAASLSCAMHGISESLCYLLQKHGVTPINSPFLNRLNSQLELNTRRVELQTQECITFVEGLREHDIDVVVLKGLPNSHRLYKHPSHRPMTDVDVLVHAKDLIQAVTVMTQLGHEIVGRTERHFELCPIGNSEYPHLWSDHPDNRRGVDVHNRLYYQPMQVTVDCHDGAWERTEPVKIRDYDIRRLADLDAMVLASLEACANLFVRRLRMIKLMDIMMLVNRISDPNQISRFILDKGHHTAQFCYPAFALAAKFFHCANCHTVADKLIHSTNNALRRLLQNTDPMDFSYVNPTPPRLGKFEGFRLSKGFKARGSVLRTLLIPARQWDHDDYFDSGRRPWMKHYASILKKFFITMTRDGKPAKSADGILRLHEFK